MYLTIFLQAGGFDIKSLAMPLAIIAVFYFFMIRPQLSRQKKEKNFQSEIGKGSKVITTSGIHGKIVEVNSSDNTVTVETGAGKIRFERSSISMELSKKLTTPSK
jgi:preprotein translocase subunit YajC